VWSVELDLSTVALAAAYGGGAAGRHGAFRAALRPFLDGGCPWCEADVTAEAMGQVRNDDGRLETTEVVPECDGRCTHAVGPLCVCKCGCKNHGLGFAAYVERSTVTGKLRTRFKQAPKNIEAARARAVAWQAIRTDLDALDEALKVEVDGWIAKQRTVRWLSQEDYKALSTVRLRRHRLAKVIGLRAHKRRMDAAAMLLGRVPPAPEVAS
jgi:hypothetical protein